MSELTRPDGPTPHASVNAHLAALQSALRRTLGDRLLGLYLDGSLALGDFDQDSDIDFVAVLDNEIVADSAQFAALQTLHDALAQLDTPWAVQLEGSYLSARAVRRHDPALVLHPNLERGAGERLKIAAHDAAWDVHRWVLRERGIVLAGPPTRALIDPVSPEQLRNAMRAGRDWLRQLLTTPGQIASRGYQSYIVLTVCRMRYTLALGAVVSKPAAARWAQAELGEPWAGLIARAWISRGAPGGAPDPDELERTLALIQVTLPALQ